MIDWHLRAIDEFALHRHQAGGHFGATDVDRHDDVAANHTWRRQ